MKTAKWEDDKVESILAIHGHEFARVKTPYRYRTLGKKHLLPKGKKTLEGNCFLVALKLAWALPNVYYYCEGYAEGLPHAWVGLKGYSEKWCLDMTWPFFTTKGGYREWDEFNYVGVCFEADEVIKFIKNREITDPSTSVSMLRYPSEILHLIK